MVFATLLVGAFGLIGFFFIAIPFLTHTYKELIMDRAAGEPFVYKTNWTQFRHTVLLDICNFLFLPFITSLYFKLGPWRTGVVLTVTVLVGVPWRYYYGRIVWTMGWAFLRYVYFLIPYVPWMIAMRCVLPKRSVRFFKHVLLLQGCYLLYTFVSVAREFLQYESALLMLTVTLPLVREATGLPLRFVVRSLESSDDKKDGIKARDEFGWTMLLLHWQQQIFAIVQRLVIVDLTHWTLFVGLCIQTSLEIFHRTTVFQRDNFIEWLVSRTRAVWHPCLQPQSPPQSSRRLPSPKLTSYKVQPIVLGGSANAVAAVAKDRWVEGWRTERAYALYLLGDQIAEYAGIFIVHAMIVTFYEAMLLVPMPWYANVERPFDRPLPLGPVAASFAAHIGAEVLSDLLCCLLEERLGVPLQRTWCEIRKWALCLTTVLTAIHTLALTWYFVGGVYNECYGVDVCHCVGKTKWGVWWGYTVAERYCKEWLYPDTGGRVPTPTPTYTP